MAVTKSILEEVDLLTGTTAYVQINSKKVSLSFDGSEQQYTIWLDKEQAQMLAEAIQKTIEQSREL